jgi:hypothetical protein
VSGNQKALKPEDLTRLFVERANAGDAAGIAALYEEQAVMAYPAGSQTVGRDAIRALWEKVLRDAPHFEQEPPLATADQRRHRAHLDPAEGWRRRPSSGGTPPGRRQLAAPARPAGIHPADELMPPTPAAHYSYVDIDFTVSPDQKFFAIVA